MRRRLRRGVASGSRSYTTGFRLGVACLGVGAVCVAAGLPRPGWALFSAAMILHVGPDRVLGSLRGVHRFAGTVLGLAVLLLLTLADPSTLLLVVCVALLLAAAEALLVCDCGLAMVVITPMVIVIGEMGVLGDIAAVTTDRLIETCPGVVVALGVLWGVSPRAYRRELLAADRVVRQSVHELTAAIDDGDRRRVGSRRRALEFDLRYATTAAIVAAHSDPRWARMQWPRHHDLHEIGYAALWAPPIQPAPEPHRPPDFLRQTDAQPETGTGLGI